MKDRMIRKIIQVRFRRLKKYWNPVRNTLDVEAIHHFRVEIKKLRAFLRLLSAGDGHSSIRIPHSLKNVYKGAGTIRDLQLYIENLKKFSDGPDCPYSYLQILKRELTAGEKNLKKVMRSATLEEAQKKIEKDVPANVDTAAIRAFVSAKMTGIISIISRKAIRDNDLHTARKYLKDIIYTAKIFKTELSLPFPVKNWNKNKEEYLTGFADDLGKFHDSYVFLTTLEKSKDQFTTQETDLINKIKGRQQRTKNQLKHTLKEKYTDTRFFRV